MNQNRIVLAVSLWLIAGPAAQSQDAVVKRDEVSIHTIEHGSMPIVASATGTITAVHPGRAILTFDNDQGKCQLGRSARLVVGENPRPLPGKVIKRTEDAKCEVEFAEALPQGTATGSNVRGLIVTDELKDVLFFGRPTGSQPNTTDAIFVLDGPSHARRVTVKYGAMSGPLIQVLKGLAAGDKVIVTNMSKWADVPRVYLK